MKLQSRLPSGAGLLHVAPLVDVVALLVIFFLLGSGYVMRSGVAVELPSSPFSMERDADAVIVTISGTGTPIITLDDRQIASLEELGGRLRTISENTQSADGDDQRTRTLFIQADKSVPNGFVFDVKVIALKNRFNVFEAAQFEIDEASGEQP